jgi:hypothetical protein
MNSPYEHLIEFVTNAGLSEDEARHAVRQCAWAMAKKGAVSYVAGGAISYFMLMNPTTAIPYTVGATAAGAAFGLAKAPECSQIREAIRFWSTVPF